MNIIDVFGDRLDELIFDSRLTRKKLASLVGINVSNIYRYLRKESLPSFQNSIKLADFFRISTDYLFGLTEENYYCECRRISFSETFAELLNENGITRYKLHTDTKISCQRLDDWYHGKRNPTMENVLTLVLYFNCSMDKIMGREK